MSEKSSPQPESGPSPIGEISQEPSAFEAFLDANQKKLIIVAILIILGLVAFVIFDGLRKLSAQNAANDLADARTIAELNTVSKDHKGKNAGGTALIFKSQLLWRDQQSQEAIQTLEEFIGAYPEHPAIGNAYTSLGSYHQQMGEIEEAKKAFNQAAEMKTSSASSLAILSLGDLARSAGNEDEAKAFYDRVIHEYEDSHFQVKGMARKRLKLIGVAPPTEKRPDPTPSAVQPAPSTSTGPITIPSPTPQAPPSAPSVNEKAEGSDEAEVPENELGELPELELPEETPSSDTPQKSESPESAPAK